MFFYHKIIFLNKNTMFLDGELYEISLEFPKEFFKYEASGFTESYILNLILYNKHDIFLFRIS